MQGGSREQVRTSVGLGYSKQACDGNRVMERGAALAAVWRKDADAWKRCRMKASRALWSCPGKR